MAAAFERRLVAEDGAGRLPGRVMAWFDVEDPTSDPTGAGLEDASRFGRTERLPGGRGGVGAGNNLADGPALLADFDNINVHRFLFTKQTTFPAAGRGRESSSVIRVGLCRRLAVASALG